MKFSGFLAVQTFNSPELEDGMDATSKKSLNAAFWYIITNFISKALLYICTPLYTRLLTTAEYGEYSNFLSWQNILITLFTFDLGAAVGIAYYDYEEEYKFEGFINTISILSYIIPGFFCIIIIIFNDFFSGVFTIRKEYLIILLTYICFNNTLNIFQAEQRVRLKYKLSAVLTLGTSIATVACTLLFVFTFQDKLKGILWGGVLVSAIVSLIIAIRIWVRNNDLKKEYTKYALRVAVPLIPHVLAGTILGTSDKVMITKYCGEEYTALYSLAYTLSLIITMVASSINKAWSPWFFDRLKYNKREYIKPISNMIVLIIAAGAFLVCLMAPDILSIVGGRAYQDAAVVMPPVIISCFINCVSTFYINIEFYSKKTMGISIATVISAGINVVLNYIFIKKLGYIAAAYTTLFSSCLTLLFHLYKVKKQNMIDVFNNRFMVLSILVFASVSELSILFYEMATVRYVLLSLLLVAFMVLSHRNKDQLVIVFRNMKTIKEGKK